MTILQYEYKDKSDLELREEIQFLMKGLTDCPYMEHIRKVNKISEIKKVLKERK